MNIPQSAYFPPPTCSKSRGLFRKSPRLSAETPRLFKTPSPLSSHLCWPWADSSPHPPLPRDSTTRKKPAIPQWASQATINMQIWREDLLQTRRNVFFNLSGFNLFFTEQPPQTEVKLFVRESSAHFFEFFAGQCAFFVECGPNATCDLAGFDSQHKRISFRIKESDAKMRPFCRFDK